MYMCHECMSRWKKEREPPRSRNAINQNISNSPAFQFGSFLEQFILQTFPNAQNVSRGIFTRAYSNCLA